MWRVIMSLSSASIAAETDRANREKPHMVNIVVAAGARLILAASDGGALKLIKPDPGPAKPVSDKVVVIIDALLFLGILAAAAAVIAGFSVKRGGIAASNDIAARHGQ